MCRREREIYKSKIPKTPSRIFFFFAAGDGNSWNSFALFLMNFGDSTKQLELVLCKIYSHNGNPYNKCGGGFHPKTTTTTQQVHNNKQTKAQSFFFFLIPTHYFLTKRKFPPTTAPPARSGTAATTRMRKKEMGFCKGKEDPF